MTAKPAAKPVSDTRAIRHKAIRAALKIAFPAVKFSITGSRGTGYGWTSVKWTDGPSRERVDAIASAFYGSSFNGMTDGYDATGNYYTFEGVTYRAGGSGVNCERSISPSFARRLLAQVADYVGTPEQERPAIVERVTFDGSLGWSLRFLDGRDANGTRLRDDRNETWGEALWRAAADRTRYSFSVAA